MPTTPSIHVQETEERVAGALDRGHLAEALDGVIRGVDALVSRPELVGRALFVPLLDQMVSEIGERLADTVAPQTVRAGTHTQLVLATETYATGGHSRIVEDLCRHLPHPVIVLTDLFGRVGSGALPVEHLRRAAGDTPVWVLAPGTAVAKTIDLMRTVVRLQPQSIWMLTHHQDAIACAALSPRRFAIPRVFVHHADHNPSLGCTIDALHHVDLVRQTAHTCAAALQRGTGYLPLHVHDQGARPQPRHALNQASVATCGAPQKYARSGPLAYPSIVAAVLGTIGGALHHIGPLPDDAVADVRAHLERLGIAPERFRPIGAVPSLWQCLRELDADLYLTSAPLGGGRAAIEAQGCGMPIVYFDPRNSAQPLLARDVYNPSAHGWSTPEELPDALRAAVADATAQSAASRAFYDAGFSSAAFAAAMQRALQRASADIEI